MKETLRRWAGHSLRWTSRCWPEASRLILAGDGQGWSIDEDRQALEATCARLGIRGLRGDRWQRHSRRQCVFWASQFSLLTDEWYRNEHRVGTAVFHGLPGTGVREFDEVFAQLERHRDRVWRVQVTHEAMREAVLGAGIAPEAIHKIPIGIDARQFRPPTAEERSGVRAELGLGPDAFVLGSFQKDGVGWGEGNDPKWIKGPDVFAEVCGRLRGEIPGLTVLLTGPARGYLKNRLRDLDIPYVHRLLQHPAEVARYYAALDTYLVASRQEGGPKAVLESMACGVPLVSTRVGQATELVDDGRNGFLVEVEAVDELAEAVRRIAVGGVDVEWIRKNGSEMARKNDFRALDPHWRDFLAGWVQ
mgnify:CR=1 FL=1